MFKRIVLILMFFFIGCSNNEVIAPDTTDMANFCPSGCANLEKLECKEGAPLLTPWECSSSAECPEGACIAGHCGFTCVQFCKDTIYNGKMLNSKCWSEISSCEEIETKCRGGLKWK